MKSEILLMSLLGKKPAEVEGRVFRIQMRGTLSSKSLLMYYQDATCTARASAGS